MENINSSDATEFEIAKYLGEAPEGFTVSDQVAAHRISICNQCPEKVEILGVDKCNVCNCIIKLKTKLTHTNCPIDKW